MNVPVPVWKKVKESIHELVDADDADGAVAAKGGHCDVAVMQEEVAASTNPMYPALRDFGT